jgi:uncharacterized protein YgbK (DUF1537 family)
LLIADDLTGACDAAVPFAARGHVTAARLDPDGDAEGLDVLAVTTESRALPAAALRGVFERTARALDGTASHIVFKKIDSTLRGNVGMEVALAVEAFACDAAIVTPAFPAMNRIMEAGRLRVGGAEFEPVEMAAFWRAQGLECAHVSPEGLNAALASVARFVSADAASDADLDAIVRCGLRSPRRILWAGSAGLASALAHALPGEPRPIGAAQRVPAVLFCLGSDHAVTLEQERNLIAARWGPRKSTSAMKSPPASRAAHSWAARSTARPWSPSREASARPTL